MSQTTFDGLADVYEAVIDWPERLGTEAPFFPRLFVLSSNRKTGEAVG